VGRTKKVSKLINSPVVKLLFFPVDFFPLHFYFSSSRDILLHLKTFWYRFQSCTQGTKEAWCLNPWYKSTSTFNTYLFYSRSQEGTESKWTRRTQALEVDSRAAGWAGKFRVLSGGRQPRLHSIQIKGQEPRVHRMRILLRVLLWALKGER
jgi:hypothetical protein